MLRRIAFRTRGLRLGALVSPARLVALVALSAPACVAKGHAPQGVQTFDVSVELLDDGGQPVPLPDPAHPIALAIGDGGAQPTRRLLVDVVAKNASGEVDETFEGYVRLSVHPGTVVSVTGDRAEGRNVLLHAGEAKGQEVSVVGTYGATRVWAEDLGYVPAAPSKPPACSNGLDDDGDGIVDFPGDPGCAFANDDTEEGGTYAAGVSPTIWYALPTVADVQGHGAQTPYEEEQVEIATAAPAQVVVTRVAQDGFYVTDVAALASGVGYSHLYAFNFSTPPGVRVCDRVTYLAGTMSEFFGFTELGFPTWDVHPWDFRPTEQGGDGPCLVPEPTEITEGLAANAGLMEQLESGLVRVKNVTLMKNFGPGLVTDGKSFGPEASNCDLNGDGKIDFTDPNAPEAVCANACTPNTDCSEWSAYLSRGNFSVHLGAAGAIQLNTGTVAGFDPPSHRGTPLLAVSGTLRNFSGGSLNWTVETRCSDDLVRCEPGDAACLANPPAPVSSHIACVRPRTIDDPGTN